MFGPYAVKEFLRNRTALTYVRVLGAGSNETALDMSTTVSEGTVKGAGFRVIGAASFDAGLNRHAGSVQFITAKHFVSSSKESIGYPIFTDNNSYDLATSDDHVNLVRGMVFMATGTSMRVLDYDQSYSDANIANDVAKVGPASSDLHKTFKIVLSSSFGSSYASDENKDGIRILTASLDPNNKNYISKILNTDPERFQEESHLLYADFLVEDEVATVSDHSNAVGILSGSGNSTDSGGDTSSPFRDLFGRFDTRYSNARTTSFISQPYTDKEFDLFHFETISDGSVVNNKYKISIKSLRGSTNPRDPYGTFTVEVRDFYDTDSDSRVLESFPMCTLNPNDKKYIGNQIGDLAVKFNFDSTVKTERRMTISGKYPSRSSYIRVVMSNDVEQGLVPSSALPFGFRGLPALKTSDRLDDGNASSPLAVDSIVYGNNNSSRLTGSAEHTTLDRSIVPPVPMRFKVTKGAIQKTSPVFAGHPGGSELANANLYWGVKFEKLPSTSSVADAIFKSNGGSTSNSLISSYSKLLGIQKLDMLVTGSGCDHFNSNKFTLARVALYQTISTSQSIVERCVSQLTASVADHMREAAYIRNGSPYNSRYTVNDGTLSNRMTLGSLMSLTSSVYFNRFSKYAKFTNMFYGGFNGVNILDKDMSRMNDRATSTDTGGKAAGTLDIGISRNGSSTGAADAFPAGSGDNNGYISSYKSAVDILTDPMVSRINILAIPGIKDSFVTDYAAEKSKDYSKALYVMDIPSYDYDANRVFDESSAPDVDQTSEIFEGRAVDNNYSATYFPDATILDDTNDQLVFVPSSVVALGALGYNDSVSFPWFAPAGFNRAALGSVARTATRLTAGNRDTLYESRINPIASFPRAGFVIFGQKTLQQARSALDRVNVRRMMLEVKRQVVSVANDFVFQQNTAETRAGFVSSIAPLLAIIQSQQGIESFSVVMDDTNNTEADVENNVLNGRIVVVPTRAVEFISIDFIVTTSGVSFV